MWHEKNYLIQIYYIILVRSVFYVCVLICIYYFELNVVTLLPDRNEILNYFV